VVGGGTAGLVIGARGCARVQPREALPPELVLAYRRDHSSCGWDCERVLPRPTTV
jgi:hypothetical protein